MIAVIGSLNFDESFSVLHIAQAGETINSHAYRRGIGGKGFNQATSLHRAGCPVQLFICVNEKDEDEVRSGCEMECVLFKSKLPSGRAIIQVTSIGTENECKDEYRKDIESKDKEYKYREENECKANENGQNAIIVLPGANQELYKYLSKWNGEIPKTVLLQGEVDCDEIIELLRNENRRIFLNASPFSSRILKYLNSLAGVFVNEIELQQLYEAICKSEEEEEIEKQESGNRKKN